MIRRKSCRVSDYTQDSFMQGKSFGWGRRTYVCKRTRQFPQVQCTRMLSKPRTHQDNVQILARELEHHRLSNMHAAYPPVVMAANELATITKKDRTITLLQSHASILRVLSVVWATTQMTSTTSACSKCEPFVSRGVRFWIRGDASKH